MTDREVETAELRVAPCLAPTSGRSMGQRKRSFSSVYSAVSVYSSEDDADVCSEGAEEICERAAVACPAKGFVMLKILKRKNDINKNKQSIH